MLLEQAQEAGQSAFVPDLLKVRAAGQELLELINDNFFSIRTPQTPTAVSPQTEGRSLSEQVVASGLHPSPAQRQPDSAPAQGSLLVVDDNEANRDVLSRRLQRQGYTVSTANNGRQALEMLRADTFDLVLLDIMMPEMDGYEVLRNLKSEEVLSHIPIIMISALSELDSVVRCIEMGAEDYLPKPFNPTLLKARIGACLEKKRARDRETKLFEQLQINYRCLQELEQLRDDLTHMIIHDLRTPLSAMIMGMQTFAQMGTLNEDQQEMLDLTQRGGSTLMAIINDLLDISKMESGALLLERHEITVSTMIDAAVKQVTLLTKAKNLALTIELEPALPLLVADETKLLRTLVNLLSNALKFTPDGGTVTVSVRANPNEPSLVFSVSDTGEGIPSEAFVRIFEKFGQVGARQNRQHFGTGLGLTFCKLAVEAHGGHIKVESAPGQGSTFCFTIPLKAQV